MAKRNWTSSVPKRFYQLSSITLILSGNFGVATSAISEEVAPAPPSARTFEQGAGSSALEEVVVTATRRSESIQDVPMSISAVSQADLEKAGATRVEDVVHMVPGLM